MMRLGVALGIIVLLVAMATMLDSTHFSNISKEDDASLPMKILHRIYFALSLSTKVNNGHIKPLTVASRGIVALGMLAVFLKLL
jgi:hypothetical protein